MQYHSKKHGVYPEEVSRVFYAVLAKYEEILLVPPGLVRSLNDSLPKIVGADLAKVLIKKRSFETKTAAGVIRKIYLSVNEKCGFTQGAIILPWASVQTVLWAMTTYPSSDTVFIAQSGPGNPYQDDLTSYLKSFPASKAI